MEEKLCNILKVIVCVLLIGITVIAVLAIIWRIGAKWFSFIDGSAFYWASEAQLLIMHWMIAFSLMIVYIKGTSLCITMFYEKYKPRLRENADRLFNILNIFVFGAITIWGGKLSLQEIATRTAALELSRGMFVYFPYVVIACFVVGLSLLRLGLSFRSGTKAKEA